MGKVPELCAADGVFYNYYQACNSCIDINKDQTEGSGRQYVDNALAQYLNYCKATDASAQPTQDTTSTIENNPIPTSWLTWYETYEPTTLFDLRTSGAPISQTTVLYKNVNITSTIPAYFFHVSVKSLISSYIPPAVFSDLAASVASAASAAAVTGDATSLVYAVLEDASRPPWFSSAVPSTYAAEMSILEASINGLRPTPVSTASGSSATSSMGSTSTRMFPASLLFYANLISRLLSIFLICLLARLEQQSVDSWRRCRFGGWYSTDTAWCDSIPETQEACCTGR